VESLNPQHPKEGIEEMKLPHADLIRSRPWNQMEVEVLGSRVWGRTWEGESSGGRAGRAGKGEWVVGSERERFKCCGAQNG